MFLWEGIKASCIYKGSIGPVQPIGGAFTIPLNNCVEPPVFPVYNLV
ncbi:hypothetical protein HMPREF9374_2269 [Desmospora sp. 8437]|nr:hypothetical protein HMPREF9374_2269 [Desmospora sp. 8437]